VNILEVGLGALIGSVYLRIEKIKTHFMFSKSPPPHHHQPPLKTIPFMRYFRKMH
jgi:hypothetical protein